MLAFGITLKDLQRASAKRPAVQAKKNPSSAAAPERKKKKTSVVPAKYRGPNDEAWSGRGITPKWLAALVAQGRKKEDFLIKK